MPAPHLVTAPDLPEPADIDNFLASARPGRQAGATQTHVESIRTHLVETTRLAGPIAMGHLSYLAMATATLILLGWLTPDVLAAGGLALRIAISTTVLSGILLCVGVLVAEAQGARDVERIPGLYWNGLYLSLALSALSFTWLSLAPNMLTALGQPPKVVEETRLFLDVMRWGEAASLIRVGLMRSVLPAFGLARILFLVTPVALGLYALLALGLVRGAWGLPEQGWLGVPVAMVATNWMAAGIMLFAVHGTRRGRQMPFAPPSIARLKEILRLGMPIGIMMAVDGAFFLTISLMVGLLGAEALAAHQIVQNFGQIAYGLAAACGDAAALRIGFRRGAKRLVDARLAGFTAIAMSVAGMASMAATIFSFPEFFLGLFIDVVAPRNQAILAFARLLIPLASVFVLMDGLYGAGMGVLRGLNDNRFPMVLVGVVYWGMGLPIAYGLSSSSALALGLVGLWGGLVISLSVVGLALVMRYVWLSRVVPSAPGTEAGIVRAGTEAASVITPRDCG